MKNKKGLHSSEIDNNAIIKKIAMSNLVDLEKIILSKKIGLTNEELNENLIKFGLNKLNGNKVNWFKKVISILFNFFNILLFLIASFEFINYFLTTDLTERLRALVSGIIVLTMTALSFFISLFQEIDSYKESNKLNELIKKKVNVIRNIEIDDISNINYTNIISGMEMVNSENITIGDIVHFSAGDIVPANIRLIYVENLLIDESALTGESMPVEKHISSPKKQNYIELENICHPGSNIISGFGLGVVFSNVNNSFISEISNNKKNDNSKSNFEYGIGKITKMIFFMVLFAAPVSCIILGLKGTFILHNDPLSVWSNAIIFGISISVGLIPESLPVILSSNLLRGSKKLASQKVLVKTLDSVQSIGGIDILCTDKTGTLTENTISLDKYYDLNLKNNIHVFDLAYLNSYYQTSLFNNIIDNSILGFKDHKSIIKKYKKISEVPFQFKKRILTVCVKEEDTKKNILITKGAFEEVIKLTTHIEINGKIEKITPEFLKDIKQKVNEMNKKQMRVIAVAHKPIEDKKEYTHKDENNLWLVGMLTFHDKPKKDVIETIKIINNLGVEVKIISGDNAIITKTICEKINFNITGMLSGLELYNLSENEKYEKILSSNVFIKISPSQKGEIIKVLQNGNHQVGFLGDGINDAIALRQSNAAISVDNATEIAKESSDFILLKKNLKLIESGLVEGRSIFVNIVRYMKIILVNKLALLIIFIVSALWLKFPLMTPFQILFSDLMFDIAQSTTIFDNVNKSLIRKPRKWGVNGWYKFISCNAILISLISFINFIIVGYGILNMQKATLDPEQISKFQTAVFSETVIIYLSSFFVLRTNSFFILLKEKVPLGMLVPVLLILLFGIALPYIPKVHKWFGLVSLNSIWYLYMLLMFLIYVLLQELLKWSYIKIFNEWI